MKSSIRIVALLCVVAFLLSACGKSGGETEPAGTSEAVISDEAAETSASMESSETTESSESAETSETAETGEPEETNATSEKEGLLANRYVQTQEILYGEASDSTDAVLVVYEDGNGTLDYWIYSDGPAEVIFDPRDMLLYTISDGAAYACSIEGNKLTLTFEEDFAIVFEPEEENFPLDSISVDPQEMIQAKKDEEYAASAVQVSEDGWIHISTPQEFLHIADDLGAKYILDADIDDWWGGQSTVFSPLGTPEEPFTGELDGNGHMVTGTLAYSGQEEAWGLFGCNAGYIHDLTIGYIDCVELRARYETYWEETVALSTLDDMGLPTETTRYYGILCGLNRGTIENIHFDDRMYVPDISCFPNANDKIYIGIVCGYNDGMISTVDLLSTDLFFYTFDKHTAVDIAFFCGYQTAGASLENVSLNADNTLSLRGWGMDQNIAPVVNAGLMVGEAEGGTTLKNCTVKEGQLTGGAMLAGADLCFGGVIGYVSGDIELSGIEINDLMVYLDAQGTDYMNEQNADYVVDAGASHNIGGIIGRVEGRATLSDIVLHEGHVQIVLRPGGDPDRTCSGGFIGICGGDLVAQALTFDGIVDNSAEQGIACAGGVCGYCAGSAEVADSTIIVGMRPIFHGSILYSSNVLGYVCGDASFVSLSVTCGIDEITGEDMGQGFIADSASTYYLATMAGYAESNVTVENCDSNVVYTLFGSPGAYYYDEGNEGLYNAG